MKSCIELHGGTLTCRTRLGKGTMFAAHLPSAPLRQVDPKLGSELKQTAEPASLKERMVQPGAASYILPSGAADSWKPVARPSGGGRSQGTSAPKTGVVPGNAGTLRILIVDDDPLVRDLLRGYLDKFKDVSVVGEAGSLAEARLSLKRQTPEVVFLDVRLPDGKGFDLLRDLKSETGVVFVSSAEEYAADAFNCDAIDYLVKPFRRERLWESLLRIRKRILKPLESEDAHPPAQGSSFLVKSVNGKQLVGVSEIKTIVAYGEYSWVYWGDDMSALLRKPLRRWEAELPTSHFIRVHRHTIVNLRFLEYAERLENGRIRLHMRKTAEPVQVSLRLTATLNRKLKALGSRTEEPSASGDALNSCPG